MDSKLKSLKVVDLKDILAKASLSAPAKANKQDLISRIIASPNALAVYNQLYPSKPPPTDDLLAPPEDVDWTADDPDAPLASPVAKDPPVVTAKVDPPPKPAASATVSTPLSPKEDEELQKRKARAARFGVPLVESSKPPPGLTKRGSSTQVKPARTDAKGSTVDNPEKLQARAARFATTAATARTTGQKRSAPVEEVDAEELEKRKKRAERFGIASAGNKA